MSKAQYSVDAWLCFFAGFWTVENPTTYHSPQSWICNIYDTDIWALLDKSK